jgi:hypothetical protein
MNEIAKPAKRETKRENERGKSFWTKELAEEGLSLNLRAGCQRRKPCHEAIPKLP